MSRGGGHRHDRFGHHDIAPLDGRLTDIQQPGHVDRLFQAVILLFSFVYVMINLTVDMMYTLLDPRIRY